MAPNLPHLANIGHRFARSRPTFDQFRPANTYSLYSKRTGGNAYYITFGVYWPLQGWEHVDPTQDEVLAEVNRDEAALQGARTLRMKETKAFHDEEVELSAAAQACDQALVVLGHGVGCTHGGGGGGRQREARPKGQDET